MLRYVSLRQSSVSHDPLFDAQEAFIILINVENSCVHFFSIFFRVDFS